MSSKNAELQPIISLVQESLPSIKEDKTKWIQLDLKVKAGSGTSAPSYKKNIRVFEDGTPQQWIYFHHDLAEIWRQNAVNGANDRVAIISAILKNSSLTAFEVALNDARQQGDGELAATTNEHVESALAEVATTIFPFRALEIQKRWMNRGMKKPFDMSTRRTAAAIARINNCLPLFPEGSPESKFSDAELVGLLEWSLPQKWRAKFDLDGYVPSKYNIDRLITECEAIERNEAATKATKNDKNYNKKDGGKFRKGENRAKSIEAQKNNDFFCSECGRNATHATVDCFILKNRAKREQQQAGGKGAYKNKPKPFSKRAFRKELNMIARKAGKNKALDLYEAALKREKSKLVKTEKKRKAKAKPAHEESESSDSDESVNMMEKPIPKKKKTTPQKKVTFADKLKRQRDKILEEEKAFLKRVKTIEKENNNGTDSSDSEEEIEIIEKDEN